MCRLNMESKITKIVNINYIGVDREEIDMV